MLNHLLKAGIYLKLALWIKPRFKGLVISFGLILITWLAHSEYLGYVDRSENNEFLEASYLIKWAIIILICIGYGFFTRKRPKESSPDKQTVAKNTDTVKENINEDDGFDFLRGKARLDSKADKILKKE